MSKGLEALYKIANAEMKEQYKATKNGFVYRVISDEYSKELKIIEKELKALEIIKEKKVNIKLFLIDKECELYNMNYGYEDLAQEEYNLLKEVLL